LEPNVDIRYIHTLLGYKHPKQPLYIPLFLIRVCGKLKVQLTKYGVAKLR